MTLNADRFQELLGQFKLVELFNELGWEKPTLKPQPICAQGKDFTLTQLAHKRGVAVFRCSPDTSGKIPPRPLLLKIEREAAKIAHEHLLIFADADETMLTWLWVSRVSGQPVITRTHTWHKRTSGEALRQKLSRILFTLDEEEALTISAVTVRIRDAFDRDRLSKAFYDKFKAQHEAFIEDLAQIADKDWYASLMLNRLMFVYFIQKKGFLDDDEDYLANRMKKVREDVGKDKFHSFYRLFLRRLFHEGLGQPKALRNAGLEKLIGKVPYLNGGLFSFHDIEVKNPNLDIPDAAFERLFAFFDAWDWHLDDRPLASGREINPDVLGYIFEKFINQKQMGAYYTKEDITGYISKYTVIPHLLERARERCKVAFEGEVSVWNLLRERPDDYIYPAMKTGVVDKNGALVPETDLPDFVQTGMKDAKARMFERRYNLGEANFSTATGERGTLPTETWREYVDRRQRCLVIREKLAVGEIRSVDDFVTLNLDIGQFMLDAISSTNSPDLVRAIWQAIVGHVPGEGTNEKFRHGVTILDPTCGSGAFLFSALNVLKPIYQACIDRMESFINDEQKLGKRIAADFEKVLAEIKKHPSPTYYIYKNIILHNLFGVDIMVEAVEICKLRLFLKLAAQVEDADKLEPLPDVDFNIRCGNTLVGYATEAQFDAANTLVSDQQHREEIKDSIADLSDLFDRFREQQTVYGGKVTADDKRALRDKLSALSLELDKYLARDYGVDPNRLERGKKETEEQKKQPTFPEWRTSHQPFHWFAEFYGVMREGGFDVVIGNPPYVELPMVNSYKTLNLELTTTGNLFSVCFGRFVHLMNSARLGVIVPISAVSTPRMTPMMTFMEENLRNIWISNFAVRPGKLFSGVDMNLTIIIGHRNPSKQPNNLYSTRYNRWNELARKELFSSLSYIRSLRLDSAHAIFKVGTVVERVILQKVLSERVLSYSISVNTAHSTTIYYHSGGRYFRKCIQKKLSNEYKELRVNKGIEKNAISLISSSLYYWYWLIESDCFHVTKKDILEFPVNPAVFLDNELIKLGDSLLIDLEKNAIVRIRHRKNGDITKEVNYYVGKSKYLLDKIDLNLAKHYALTDEETDFIINYDIKYRMGGADDEA
jgi:hypothetical protein